MKPLFQFTLSGDQCDSEPQAFRTPKEFRSLKITVKKKPEPVCTEFISIGVVDPRFSRPIIMLTGNGATDTFVLNSEKPTQIFSAHLRTSQEVKIEGYDEFIDWEQPDLHADIKEVSQDEYNQMDIPDHLK